MRLIAISLALSALFGLSPAAADGLAPAGPATQGQCYASGTSGPRVPCVLQGQTWTRVLRPTDDVSTTTTRARGGVRARAASDRAADVLNLLDFVPQGTAEADVTSGAVDAAPVFQAAIASRPSGSKVTLTVPSGTYRLNSDVGEAGRVVHVDMRSGALAGSNYGSTLGPGVLYVTRVTLRSDYGIVTQTQGTATNKYNVIGNTDYVTNNGGNSGAGYLFSYQNYNVDNGPLPNGGDVAHNIVAQWHNMKGSGFVTWDIGITPIIPNSEITAPNPRGFAIVGKEINIAHNGPTGGWSEHDPKGTGDGIGVATWNSIGLQVVPDSWTPTGRKGGHMTVGVMVAPDVMLNNRTDGPGGQPYINGVFSPFHIANNATAPGGRGMYFGGNTDGLAANYPYAGIEVRHNWPMFVNLENATLTSGWIVNAKPGQAYRWSTPAGDVTIGATTAGRLTLAAPGGVDLPAVAWTSYTPSSSGVVGGSGGTLGAVTGRYQLAGKRLDVSLTIPVTAGGTGNSYVFTVLPTGMLSRGDCVLAGAEMNNVTSRSVSGRITAGSGLVAIFNSDGTYPGATGARLTINGACELQ